MKDMKIKMTLSKTDKILGIINYFLPHTDLYQYHYEADSIACNTRKNSSVKTIEKLIKEYLPNIDEEIITPMAQAIKQAI